MLTNCVLLRNLCGVQMGSIHGKNQGKEFTHRFSERIARFLQKKERMSD